MGSRRCVRSTELDDDDAKVSGLETGGGELAEHVERWDLLQQILNTGNICKDVNFNQKKELNLTNGNV